nr:TniQ family protein [uncultured Azospirillum sp.]
MPTDDVPRLPIRVRPERDESLLGLMVRTGAVNGFGSPDPVVHAYVLSNHDLPALATSVSAIPLLSRLLALDESAIAVLSYAGPDGGSRLLGHPVHPHFISARRRKVCPRCLDESGYHRALWDMALMTICPDHRLRLVERCPACGSRLGWRVPSPCACRCGYDLRREPGVPVPVGELAGAGALRRLFLTAPDALDGLAAEVGVGGVLQLVYVFGGTELGVGYRAKPARFADKHPDRAHLLLDAGWRACAEWPGSFHRFLDGLAERAVARHGRYGAAKRYGGLPAWLGSVADEPHGRVAWKAFTDHVAMRPDFSTRLRAVRRKRAEAALPDACVTLVEAARTLGVAFDTLRAFVDRHGLVVTGSGGKGEPVLLRAATVDRLRADLRELVDQDAAWRLLGIGKRTFVGLRGTDLLPPPASGLAADLLGRSAWRVADLEAFLRRFEAAVRPAHGTGELVGLPTAARALGGLGMGAKAVLRAVLEGQLHPAALRPERRGLARMVFHKADAEALRDTLGAAARRTLSVDGAARALGIKQEVAYHWVRRGWLPTVKVPGTTAERGGRITEEALVLFRREYVTAPDLRGTRGLGTSKKLALQLIDMGARPVSGPSVDGGRQFLFRRAEIDALLARRRSADHGAEDTDQRKGR